MDVVHVVPMSDNSEEPEVELYEEVVGNEYWNSSVTKDIVNNFFVSYS